MNLLLAIMFLLLSVVGIFIIFIGIGNLIIYSESGKWQIALGGTLFVFALFVILPICLHNIKQNPSHPKCFMCASRNLSEYTVFLDGEEVDLDKIDISLYAISYDDEKKIIYITNK